MKKLFKKAVAGVLAWQVRRLRERHPVRVIAVTGSIGKTSSKLAIASVLSKGIKTRYQRGNYNDIVSVPLVFFGESLPNIFNPFSWAWIFIKNEIKIRRDYPYEAVVLELGTDGPGQIREFRKYVKVDIGVLTSISPEHMQFFADLDAVAREELGITEMAGRTFINKDLVDAGYLKDVDGEAVTYATGQPADVRLTDIRFSGDEAAFSLLVNGKKILNSGHHKITEPQLYSICAAAAIAHELGLTPEQIDEGIRSIPPVSGRMQHLDGAGGSVIIDDTYNASPQATLAALDTLYRIKAGHKIAVLGNMNELGHYARPEHIAVGEYCNPKELDLVITIGPDANKYLAPAAAAKGCKVKTFNDPYSAGKFIRPLLGGGSVVLVKGSQNKVFAEEAVKLLLENPSDRVKLVRQSPYWLKVKRRAF
jgi:UDP-N-acetylmuramoyl-tripeptide--D-alanyl-D-alanine ligase